MNMSIANSKSLLSLLFLSIIAIFLGLFFPETFIFYLSADPGVGLIKVLGILPLFAAIVLILTSFLQRNQGLKVIAYILFFIVLTDNTALALVFILGHGVLFFLESKTRDYRLSSAALFLLGTLGLYVPVLIYLWQMPLLPWQLYGLLIFKTCMMMRVVSWIVDRRVYQRRDFSSVSEFFEFIFCPIFFVFPSQIQYFLFRYFHESKFSFTGSFSRNFLMGLWGLAAILIFGYGNAYFWKEMYYWPAYVQSSWRPFLHLFYGLYWLVLIYLQQVGGMAFQVCVARLLGYQIKYDMHYPLLARTPLDYLRRHSSYVRDYIVEVGVRPLSLPLLRGGWAAGLVFPLVSILSYVFFIFPQTGYRADYERPVMSSLVLSGFLTLYVLLPILTGNGDHLARPVAEKSLRCWNAKDYMSWIVTILLVASSKSILGLALAYFGSRH
jgi:hypothetical protein